MEARERSVLYFRTAQDRAPFRDWRLNLDESARAAVDARIARFRGGNLGDSKPLGGGILESRIYFGPGYRIYYAFDGRDVIVLLCGGHKGTQNADITQARAYWSAYKASKRESEHKKKR